MALATRCPHCQTTFRVAHDQLKLRAGLVRCGACKEIFNGVENLVRRDESVAPATASSAAAPPVTTTAEKSFPSTTPDPDTPAGNGNAEPPVQAEATTAAMAAGSADPAKPAPRTAPEKTATPAMPATTTTVTAAAPAAAGPGAAATSHPTARLAVPASDAPAHKSWPRPDSVADTAAPAAGNPSWPVPRQATPASGLPLPQKPSATPAPERPWQSPPFFVKEPTPGIGRGNNALNNKNGNGAKAATADPMLRMTLLDLATIVGGEKGSAASVTPDNGDALNRAMDELRKSPWRGLRVKGPGEETDFLDAHDEPEPEFVQRARRQQRFGRMLRTGLLAGTGLLALLLFVQTTMYYRNQIAARLPGTAAGLTRLCNVLGCSIGLPMQIDAVSIESSELQVLSSSQNTYVLVALLRNRSNVNQTWPAIELTINDSEDKPAVRRVFAPADYLSAGQTTAQGLLSNSEQPVRLSLTLMQGKAAGYRVYLFYP